jgi:hypothetical protein
MLLERSEGVFLQRTFVLNVIGRMLSLPLAWAVVSSRPNGAADKHLREEQQYEACADRVRKSHTSSALGATLGKKPGPYRDEPSIRENV